MIPLWNELLVLETGCNGGLGADRDRQDGGANHQVQTGRRDVWGSFCFGGAHGPTCRGRA